MYQAIDVLPCKCGSIVVTLQSKIDSDTIVRQKFKKLISWFECADCGNKSESVGEFVDKTTDHAQLLLVASWNYMNTRHEPEVKE